MDHDFGSNDFENDFEARGDRLKAEFDPRLADVWLTVFASEIDIDPIKQQLGWFLRMAYLKGYEDALQEPIKGQLYQKLGIRAPAGVRERPGGRS